MTIENTTHRTPAPGAQPSDLKTLFADLIGDDTTRRIVVNACRDIGAGIADNWRRHNGTEVVVAAGIRLLAYRRR